MSRYLRFTSAYVFVLASTAGILLGGAWMWLGISVIYAVMITGDELLGDDYSEPAYRMPRLLDSLLSLAVPVLTIMCCALAWMAADSDLAGLGAGEYTLTVRAESSRNAGVTRIEPASIQVRINSATN